MKGKFLKQLLAGAMGAAIACSATTAANAALLLGISPVANKADGEGKIIASYDFEDGDVSAFTNRGDTDTTVISVSTDNAVSGSYSLCASERSSSWNGPAFRLDDKCEPGVAYLLSAQAMGQWYTSITLSMQYDDAGGETHYSNLLSLNGNGWQEINDVKITFSDDQSNVYVYFEGGSDNIYVDDFVLKEAPVFHPEEDIVSLKNVYSQYFKIGTAVTTSELAPVSTKELILKHFNSITAGNELKPDAVLDKNACLAMAENGDDTNPQVTLASARSILNFARDNNIPVRGHVLVWHQQTPTWFFKENYDENGDWVSKEKMLERMENYIKNVFAAVEEEYPDVDFYAWDVVNECWLDDGSARKPGSQEEGSANSPWVQIFGDNSFIKPAFEFAKKYAPEGTKLYYNDFNEYMPQKTDAIIAMVEEINSDGHYIDGIGMQSHLDVRSGPDAFPAVNVYEKALAAFCATGLDVQITELDVTVNDNTLFAEQAQYYSDIMDSIMKYSDYISAVVFWGTTDDQSWRASNYPLLFNEDYTAKESFYAIVDGLEEVPDDSTTTTVTTTASQTSVTTTTTGAVTWTARPEGYFIEVDTYPTKTAYEVGEDLDLSGLVIKYDLQTRYEGENVGGIMHDEITAELLLEPDEVTLIDSDGNEYSGSELSSLPEGVYTVSCDIPTCYQFGPNVYDIKFTYIITVGDVEISTIAGDANCDGKVNMADAVLIMQVNANPDGYSLSEQGRINADVIGDGDGVTNKDALAIQQYEAGIVTTLPIVE